jgi:hypothetical protein
VDIPYRGLGRASIHRVALERLPPEKGCSMSEHRGTAIS